MGQNIKISDACKMQPQDSSETIPKIFFSPDNNNRDGDEAFHVHKVGR